MALQDFILEVGEVEEPNMTNKERERLKIKNKNLQGYAVLFIAFQLVCLFFAI